MHLLSTFLVAKVGGLLAYFVALWLAAFLFCFGWYRPGKSIDDTEGDEDVDEERIGYFINPEGVVESFYYDDEDRIPELIL
jgi:hypothetical protein